MGFLFLSRQTLWCVHTQVLFLSSYHLFSHVACSAEGVSLPRISRQFLAASVDETCLISPRAGSFYFFLAVIRLVWFVLRFISAPVLAFRYVSLCFASSFFHSILSVSTRLDSFPRIPWHLFCFLRLLLSFSYFSISVIHECDSSENRSIAIPDVDSTNVQFS
jgi:hypothetical protein